MYGVDFVLVVGLFAVGCLVWVSWLLYWCVDCCVDGLVWCYCCWGVVVCAIGFGLFYVYVVVGVGCGFGCCNCVCVLVVALF